MRIDTLHIRNFRGFAEAQFEFHPQFNLLVGENASGKTSVLDALSVAAGSWFLGIAGCANRHIKDDDVRCIVLTLAETTTREEQYPVEVSASGVIDWNPNQPRTVTWKRDVVNTNGKTRFKEAVGIKKAAADTAVLVRSGVTVNLPLIAYYGAGRLWVQSKDMEGDKLESDEALSSRFDGYKTSIDPRISFPNLFRWLKHEKYVALEKSSERQTFRVVKAAMRHCLQGCVDLDYDVSEKNLIVQLEGGKTLPYHLLSDGQRAMLALVADIAIKAATLNPHLSDQVLKETRGVVLIDELDLHLHPRWQRHVVADLKNTFPSLQFFASSHSPQVIGETPHDEIILLKNDGSWSRPDASFPHKSPDSSASPQQEILRDLGSLVLKSQLIAHSLSVILATIRSDSEITPLEAARLMAECRTKTLEQLINELSQSTHPTFKGGFNELLRAYCKNRNLMVHNLMLTKDFAERFENDPDYLKGFIPLFDDIARDLLTIQSITHREKFGDPQGADIASDSAISAHADPTQFEKLNSVLRHFMSEKWKQKSTKPRTTGHPRQN